MKKVVFCRIGWMKYYNGPQKGDSKPIGGGDYNSDDVGHEILNFHNYNGYVYGYVRAKNHDKAFSMVRISGDKNAEYENEVLVIFYATHPDEKSQRVVGWYRNATVNSTYDTMDTSSVKGISKTGLPEMLRSCINAKYKDSVLLPTEIREWVIPRAQSKDVEGGSGQSQIYYTREANGDRREFPWLLDIVEKIENYTGPNLQFDSSEEYAEKLTSEADTFREESLGFQSNAQIRKAVEVYAEDRSIEIMEERGYTVTRKGKPYDLLCEKDNQVIYVEVKGSQGGLETIFLTRNEVIFSRENKANMVLFKVENIIVNEEEGKYICSGGDIIEIKDWSPADKGLSAYQYRYIF